MKAAPSVRQGIIFYFPFILLFTSLLPAHAQTQPMRLSDVEFWQLSAGASEAGGEFRSDNLVSNERYYSWALDDLLAVAPKGRAYLGVGPEQNFSYIAALEPKVAVIVDIRRGNLHLHLMYKALFELSRDRVEFVGRLLSKPRPEGLTPESGVAEIFDAYAKVAANPQLYHANLEIVWDHLTSKHGFPLPDSDKSGIDHVYRAFYRDGAEITYNSPRGSRGAAPTYAGLMTATDPYGVYRSYLASEDSFLFVKDLQTRNMIVPVVGNFAGPKAIRTVAAYLEGMEETVSAFYISNVEDYLGGESWDAFCRNAATLPLDAGSTFIRSIRGGQYAPAEAAGLHLELHPMLSWLSPCIPTRVHQP